MFERWGETLAMDFTHGANNLGYHLGSLLEKNPGWCNIVSVVIDKDFVEWWVLMADAKVVLCQFHAIIYWKKVMKRSKFRLTISQQEDLIALMTR
ncbi:hypothetical protein L916_17613, partial [Phytophthora nicotianae]